MRHRRTASVRVPEVGKAKVLSFPTYEAMADVALGTSQMPDIQRASQYQPDSFAGGSWADAEHQARHGDTKGARRLAPAILAAASDMVTHAARLDPVYKLDEGRWVDVARFINGEPESWVDLVETQTMPRKGIAIAVNVAAAWNIPANKLDAVGVALGGAILGLQALGYSVTVYAAQRITGDSGKGLLTIAPLNPGGAVLDVARLSFILRPYFLRRFIFSLLECGLNADDRRTWGVTRPGGYGQQIRLPVKEVLEVSGLSHAVVVDMQAAVNYPQGVSDQILAALKTQGATNE